MRKLSGQLAVSISTVLQAYRVLEQRGRIEARPQSGYYVKARLWQPPAAPAISSPSAAPTRVTCGELVMKVLRAQAMPDVVPLGAAVPGPQCLPTAQLNRLSAAVARRSTRGAHLYDAPPGCPALRAQVARRYMEAGCALSPDEIVTTCGSTEALMLCLRAVASPGDTIAIESPTYYGILQLIESLGMRAQEIPTHPDDGVSLDALRYAIDEHEAGPPRGRVKACLFVTNFNNPLGSRMPDDRKRELVELLVNRERPIPLVEDDVYGDVGFDAGGRPKVCKAFDTTGNVLLCSSFSKTLAPGYRVGWCSPGRFQAEVERMKVTSTLATPTLPQLTIAEFLANGGYERHLRKIRRTYADQIRRFTQAVTAYFPPETRATRPSGGSVLWVELPERVDAMGFHDRALAEHRISIAPGPIFSAKCKYGHFIRINCGHPWSDDIERAVEALGRLARSS